MKLERILISGQLMMGFLGSGYFACLCAFSISYGSAFSCMISGHDGNRCPGIAVTKSTRVYLNPALPILGPDLLLLFIGLSGTRTQIKMVHVITSFLVPSFMLSLTTPASSSQPFPPLQAPSPCPSAYISESSHSPSLDTRPPTIHAWAPDGSKVVSEPIP